jgi:hypothetical protein
MAPMGHPIALAEVPAQIMREDGQNHVVVDDHVRKTSVRFRRPRDDRLRSPISCFLRSM